MSYWASWMPSLHTTLLHIAERVWARAGGTWEGRGRVSSPVPGGWGPNNQSRLEERAQHTMVTWMRIKKRKLYLIWEQINLPHHWTLGKGPVDHEKGSPETTRARPPAGGPEATPAVAGWQYPGGLAQPALFDPGQAPESSEPQKHLESRALNFGRAQDRTIYGLEQNRRGEAKGYLWS